MAEVSDVRLHEEDDDGVHHQDNVVVTLNSTHFLSSHNFEGFDTSDLEFPPSEFRISAIDHQHQNHRSSRSQILANGASDADSSIINIDFFDRENQVNFVVDLFHECVEQSDPNPNLDLNLDLNFGVIDELGLNNLELDLGLGLGGYTGDDNNSGFIVADCGDEFFVSRRGSGTLSESGESSNSGGPDYFMGGLGVVGMDSDLEDRGNGGVDDFELGDDNGSNDEDTSLPICWDSFQLEDSRDENNNDDFEWEEVEGRIDAEELANTRMNSLSCSVTPCRALAKSLLKRNRQDFLLCGVYARREAVFGNIDHARKVFDMALASIEAVPLDSQSNAFLIFFWYAEVELANSSGSSSDSGSRAMHILYCLGSGVKYVPFKCQPSSVQQLRARQGFKERIRMVRAMGAQGITDDEAIALICSAALFEELTAGWTSAIEVFDQSFSMVLPERRTQSHQLEFLFNYYVRMLWKHHQQSNLSKVWDTILQGLQLYPQSPELYNAFVEIGYLHTAPSKMRWRFDDNCQKKPSVIVWLFALSFEISRGSSHHRVHALFERALGTDSLRNSVILWRWYITYEINVACDPSAARRIYFRAIHACPWSKKLWLDGFVKLNSILTAKELSDLQEVMRDKELNLRTDIYEILLKDEVES